MKITAEVREFAGKQNQGVEGFVAAGPSGAETAAASKAAAIKGMEEMSALYNARAASFICLVGGSTIKDGLWWRRCSNEVAFKPGVNHAEAMAIRLSTQGVSLEPGSCPLRCQRNYGPAVRRYEHFLEDFCATHSLPG